MRFSQRGAAAVKNSEERGTSRATAVVLPLQWRAPLLLSRLLNPSYTQVQCTAEGQAPCSPLTNQPLPHASLQPIFFCRASSPAGRSAACCSDGALCRRQQHSLPAVAALPMFFFFFFNRAVPCRAMPCRAVHSLACLHAPSFSGLVYASGPARIPLLRLSCPALATIQSM